MKHEWNNGMGSRRRKTCCYVVSADGVPVEFTGKTIPALAVITAEKYEKNGKWSNTTFHFQSPDDCRVVAWRQSWEEGLFFPQGTWEEAYSWWAQHAPQTTMAQFRAFIAAEFAKAGAKFDAVERELAAMAAPPRVATRRVVVSRHAAAIAFIAEAIGGTYCPEDGWVQVGEERIPVLSEVRVSDVNGITVYGNLPMQLAALAVEVYALEFEGAPPRGAEYGLAEMKAAGAKLTPYKIIKL